MKRYLGIAVKGYNGNTLLVRASARGPVVKLRTTNGGVTVGQL